VSSVVGRRSALKYRATRLDWSVQAWREVVAVAAEDPPVRRARSLRAAVDESRLAFLRNQPDDPVMRACGDWLRDPAPAPGARRGRVAGWSDRSRHRCMRAIGEVSDVGQWVMVTLTLPGDWIHRADGSLRSPESLRADLDALRKRAERRWQGWEWSGPWKLEVQSRTAPHFHLGVTLPPCEPREFRDFLAVAWHELIAHDGCRCAGGCEDRAHLRFGVHLDSTFARRHRSGSGALAAYFAKHGVWKSKDYQHSVPSNGMRQALGVGRVLGLTTPATVDQVVAIAMWDHPGRWWGLWRCRRVIQRDAPLVDPRQVAVMRLLSRKIVARRTAHEALTSCGRPFVARRVWRSLLDSPDRGWWLTARDGPALWAWLLETSAALAHLEGLPLARALHQLQLPATEPQRLRLPALLPV